MYYTEMNRVNLILLGNIKWRGDLVINGYPNLYSIVVMIELEQYERSPNSTYFRKAFITIILLNHTTPHSSGLDTSIDP